MAEYSLPQPGNSGTNPAYVDAGPYLGDEWARLFRVLFTGDNEATQGVLKGVWNELEPTHPAALNVSINTGVGICNGHVYFNDTSAVSITVNGGANRSDALCIVENNTNAAITVGGGTNYNTVGDVNIPPYSARLAVVKDIGANFSQTTALYMVQLATFTTGAANITNFTDVRSYCHFATCVDETQIDDRTRHFFVNALVGYDDTLNTQIVLYAGSSLTFGPEIIFPDGSDCFAYGRFAVPPDYNSGMTATAVLIAAGSGNLYCDNAYKASACGERTGTGAHSGSTGFSTVAITSGAPDPYLYCVQEVSISGVTPDDYVVLTFSRDGADASDTISANIRLSGWLVEYTADS